MRGKLVGKENVNYVSKKTGKPVVGTSLHLEFIKNGVDGKAVATEFTKLPVMDIPVGSEIDLTYDQLPGSKYSTLSQIKKVG